MADINLTQAEADALIALEKHRIDGKVWDSPSAGGAVSIPLTSSDRKENFMLDISRSQINLARGKYQNRGRKVVVLVRLDFGGPPHRNPDGKDILCPHIHIYREGFADKWAYSLPSDIFADITPSKIYDDFIKYCNITLPPKIQKGLWDDC
jgi:hypothetical protein